MEQESVVEWLEEQIRKEEYEEDIDWDGLFKQAKQKEKEQREKDFRAGWHGNKNKDWNCEFYLTKHLGNDYKTK